MVELESYSRRVFALGLVIIGFGAILFLQIFNLQIFKHDYYMSKAMTNQQGYTESDPRRGEIFIQDYHSNTDFRVATNTTLDTVFADPSLILDHTGIGEKLAPILFSKDLALRAEELRLKEQRNTLPPDLTEQEILDILKPRDLAELKKEFQDEIITKMAQKTRPQILLYRDPPTSVREAIRKLNIAGIEITDKDIIVYPLKISNPQEIAKNLSPILDIGISRLTNLLEGKNRYVVLASRVEPEAAAKIKDLIAANFEGMRGIGFEEKSYRYYPEKQLAAQLLGFVDQSGGVYGIESYFDDILTGTRGIFKTALDGMGKQITVGDDTLIKPAIDGADIYLTVDRSIQLEVERLLKNTVESTRADAGQVLIIDPKTGKFMAMAHYPSFDPNEFWTALDTEEIFLTEEELLKVQTIMRGKTEETFLVYDEAREDKLQLLPVRSEETGETYYEKYKNKVGSSVYRNRAAQDLYEPGSVFKAITMSAAIDDESVTPATTLNDSGPIKVDEFTIDNALGQHYGTISMTRVLETSNNIGMAWVSREIGRNLFHTYMMKYGFGKRTDIQLDDEKQGYIEPFTAWSESELVTHAFGQGISTTTIQMITAFSAFANGGLLMQPTLVNKIVYNDGKVDEIEPTIVRRVISKKTADTLTAMLVSVVDKGQSKTARIPGYSVAGKTGTSQTYKNGKPLEGAGTTIATFAGFAPANDPRFVILVKVDRPRSSQWADVTALPLFKEVANFLLQYLGVPPDKL